MREGEISSESMFEAVFITVAQLIVQVLELAFIGLEFVLALLRK